MTIASNKEAEQQQYLTFLLADEEYAISILKVKEIIEYGTATSVPKMPKWIRGVINLRGSVMPVVDLGMKFGLEQKPLTKTMCVVIVETQFENQPIAMGVLVDAVSQVIDLTAESMQPVPEFGTRVKVEYLLGMAQLGKKFALVLDMDKVLSTDELLDLNEVSALAASEQNGESAEDTAATTAPLGDAEAWPKSGVKEDERGA